MPGTPKGKNRFDAFCRRAFDYLKEEDVRHLVIGGLAVAALGEPRMTADVDVIAFLSESQADGLIQRANLSGFDIDPKLESERLRATGTLRFRQPPFQLDIILASLPFEEAAYSRALHGTLFGRRITFPSAEDMILFKVLAGRNKDLADANSIIKRHESKLDWSYIDSVLRGLCDQAEDMTAWRKLETLRNKTSG